MGRPILGKIANIQNVSRKMVVDYHESLYYGKNMVIVGVGDFSHEEFVEKCSKHFNVFPEIPTKQPVSIFIQNLNFDKPKFQNSLHFKSYDFFTDELNGINVGCFHEAPSWLDEDYYAFLIFQRIFGDTARSTLESQIYSATNINTFQKHIKNYKKILNQRTVYAPYRDCGLFGFCFYGDAHIDTFSDMVQVNREWMTMISENIKEYELERAKRCLYSEILNHQSQDDVTQTLGNQILYLDRVVTKAEIAKRISYFTAQHLEAVAKKWFLNEDASFTIWGNDKPIKDGLGIK